MDRASVGGDNSVQAARGFLITFILMRIDSAVWALVVSDANQETERGQMTQRTGHARGKGAKS